MLFIPSRPEPLAAQHLTAGESYHQHHNGAQHCVHYIEVHNGEDVEGTVAPSVGLEQGRSVVWPFDSEDPVVAKREPGH